MNSNTSTVVDSWLDLAAENRGTDRFQLSYAAFRLILIGEAPNLAELSAAVEIAQDTAIELIHQMKDEGRLRFDASETRVVGAAGLSLEPSRHTIRMNGREYGAWCALDAVGIPAGLNVDARVDSVCAVTGEPVSIEIRRGSIEAESPHPLLISLVPASVVTSVHDTLCNRILFHSKLPASPDSEAEYLSTTIVAELGGRLWRDGIPL